MAPLVYWQVAEGVDHRNRYDQYDQLTAMTHNNDVAKIATRVHGDVLTTLLDEQETYHPWAFAQRIQEIAEYHEKAFRSTWDISNALLPLRHLIHSRDIVGEMKGWYAAFLHGTLDYEKTVYTAVNMGGDADSTASIASSMYNFAWLGEFSLPEDAYKIQDLDKLEKLSHKLSTEALKMYTGFSPW